MNLYKIDICPESDFLSPLKGDMLFGMFCYVLAEYYGEQKLEQYLEGYTQNTPFIVFSDAFPVGYFPRPYLPRIFLENSHDDNLSSKELITRQNRKDFKQKKWLACGNITLPSNQMGDKLEKKENYQISSLKTSNRVNPLTNHADGGIYSAYTTEPFYYSQNLSLYVVIDEVRITLSEVENILKIIGSVGFGKKASSGKGKFSLLGGLTAVNIENSDANALMTLAPSCPPFNIFNPQNSFYSVFVRFGRYGRHGSKLVQPFKNPVITMDSAAVLQPNDKNMLNEFFAKKFVGSGINNVSETCKKTVFQGYAPIVPLLMVKGEDDVSPKI